MAPPPSPSLFSFAFSPDAAPRGLISGRRPERPTAPLGDLMDLFQPSGAVLVACAAALVVAAASPPAEVSDSVAAFQATQERVLQRVAEARSRRSTQASAAPALPRPTPLLLRSPFPAAKLPGGGSEPAETRAAADLLRARREKAAAEAAAAAAHKEAAAAAVEEKKSAEAAASQRAAADLAAREAAEAKAAERASSEKALAPAERVVAGSPATSPASTRWADLPPADLRSDLPSDLPPAQIGPSTVSVKQPLPAKAPAERTRSDATPWPAVAGFAALTGGAVALVLVDEARKSGALDSMLGGGDEEAGAVGTGKVQGRYREGTGKVNGWLEEAGAVSSISATGSGATSLREPPLDPSSSKTKAKVGQTALAKWATEAAEEEVAEEEEEAAAAAAAEEEEAAAERAAAEQATTRWRQVATDKARSAAEKEAAGAAALDRWAVEKAAETKQEGEADGEANGEANGEADDAGAGKMGRDGTKRRKKRRGRSG